MIRKLIFNLIVIAFAIMAMTAIVAAIWMAHPDRRQDLVFNLIAEFIGATIIILTVDRIVEFRELTQEKRSVTEKTVEALSQPPKTQSGDVQGIAASQIRLLYCYHEIALAQAKKSYWWASGAAVGGLVFCMMAVINLLTIGTKDLAVISVVAGGIAEAIAGINFYLYSKASSQLADLQARLDLTQRLLLANSICEGLEGDFKQRTRSHLVQAVARMIATPTQSKTSLVPVPHSDVRITYVEYDPPGKNIEGEHVRVKNSGKVAIDVTDWTMCDKAGHKFTFPTHNLQPGTYVRVWTRDGKNTSTDLYWGRDQAVWNARGDCAYLWDNAGALIDTYCYERSILSPTTTS